MPRSRRKGRVERLHDFSGESSVRPDPTAAKHCRSSPMTKNRIPRHVAPPPRPACRQPRSTSVMADYAAHFAEGMAAGRSEAEIAAALGDPLRLARELRAEAGPAPLGGQSARPATSSALWQASWRWSRSTSSSCCRWWRRLMLFTLIAGLVLIAPLRRGSCLARQAVPAGSRAVRLRLADPHALSASACSASASAAARCC